MLIVSVLRMVGKPIPVIGRTQCQELKVLTKITAWFGVNSKQSSASTSAKSAWRLSSL